MLLKIVGIIAYLLSFLILYKQKMFIEIALEILLTLILLVTLNGLDEELLNSKAWKVLSGKTKKAFRRFLYSKIAEIAIIGVMLCATVICITTATHMIDVGTTLDAALGILLMFKIAVRVKKTEVNEHCRKNAKAVK